MAVAFVDFLADFAALGDFDFDFVDDFGDDFDDFDDFDDDFADFFEVAPFVAVDASAIGVSGKVGGRANSRGA